MLGWTWALGFGLWIALGLRALGWALGTVGWSNTLDALGSADFALMPEKLVDILGVQQTRMRQILFQEQTNFP